MRYSKYLKVFVFTSIGFFLGLGFLSLKTHAGVPYRGTLGITSESDAGGAVLTQKEFVQLKKRVNNIKNLLLRQKSKKSNLNLVLKMSEKLFRACGHIEISSNIDKCHAAAAKAEMQMKNGIESSDTDIKTAIDIMINEVIAPFNGWVADAVAVLQAREKYAREHPEEQP